MNKLISVVLLVFIHLQVNAYWQQEVNYDIHVELEDQNHLLHAYEKIIYVNNSPDTLHEMFFHLWPNAYQSGTPLAKQILEDNNTLLYFGDSKYTGRLDSLSLKVDGTAVPLKNHALGNEVAWFNLPNHLLPGDSIEITTPFRVKVPYGEVSRMGHLDDSYQITQWYPKPAVYDHNGWNVMPYLTTGEFYSEYGKFDVTVTVPSKYKIAASGNQIENTLLHEGKKTVRYQLDNVHDFAWFADTTWQEEVSEVVLPYSGRTVKTYIKYRPENKNIYENSVKYVDSAIYYYSLWVGDYPYSICGAVDGGLTAGAGMEYPTITVLGPGDSRKFHEEVILHEIGHNWFYGVLGSNERKHPWMDEGMNSYYERRYYEEVKTEERFDDFIPVLRKFVKSQTPKHTEYHHYLHDFVNTRNSSQPLNLSADQYSNINYGAVVYSKSAVILNYLEKYLGKPLFDQIMQDYFETWKFKHPQPKDFQAIFKKHTSKNLDWFFDDLLTTTYTLDYKINNAGYSWDNKEFDVVVTNVGEIAGPLVITALKRGKVINTAWYEGFWGTQQLSFPYGDYDKVVIDFYHDMPEINRKNNSFTLFSFIGNIEPLEASFPFDFEKPDKTQIFFSPIMGYNLHDDLQLGVAATNLNIQERKFRFLVLPQFSFGTNKLVGNGQFTYSIYPGEYFDKINVNLNLKRQGLDLGIVPGQIEKIEAGLDFKIHQPNARSSFKSSIEAKLSAIEIGFDRRESIKKNYITFQYSATNKKAINPYSGNIRLQAFDQNWKLSTEFNYGITLNSKKQTIDIRTFAGCFLQSVNAYTERFNLSGNNGTLIASSDLENFNYTTPDYLLEHSTYGRFISEGTSLARQQIFIQDAGFKSGMSTISSTIWMASLNIVVPFPIKYISFFSDIASSERIIENYLNNPGSVPFLYDYGLQLNIKKNYFEIYFPFGYSDAIDEDYNISGLGNNPLTAENEFNFFNRIKFMIHVDQLYKLLK